MALRPLTILVTGATGSIGRPVVEVALGAGHRVRALVRKPGVLTSSHGLDIVTGDLTSPPTLRKAVDGIDAIVFTHGTYGSVGQAEAVDFGGVRNVLGRAGSTTTIRTSAAWYSCKGTSATRARPGTASSPGGRSRRSSSLA